MRILVTGGAGQLGTDVCAELNKRDIDYVCVDIVGNKTDSPSYGLEPSPCLVKALDITDAGAVNAFFNEHKPQSVIHCAAYTAVDKAEDEPELCFKVNAEGTENIARACKEINAELIYISTDYVFEGNGDEPFETDAVKAPISTYGKSKLTGEDVVKKYLEKFYIVRISWVFGDHGNNFVKTMMMLASRGDGPSASQTNSPPISLNVVSDQIGSPTYTPDLAVLLCDMVLSGKYGEYHATNEGYCSWAEFAAEIMRQSGSTCEINPIPSELYPTKAVRPKNSRLSKSSLDKAGFNRLPQWQDALKRFIGGT